MKVLGGAEEVLRLLPGPAVVLATLPSLAAGASRRLLAAWGGDERNAIVLPGRPHVRRTPRPQPHVQPAPCAMVVCAES